MFRKILRDHGVSTNLLESVSDIAERFPMKDGGSVVTDGKISHHVSMKEYVIVQHKYIVFQKDDMISQVRVRSDCEEFALRRAIIKAKNGHSKLGPPRLVMGTKLTSSEVIEQCISNGHIVNEEDGEKRYVVILGHRGRYQATLTQEELESKLDELKS